MSHTHCSAIQQLSQWYGIEPEYTNIWGETVYTSESTQQKILTALGCDVRDEHTATKTLQQLEYTTWNHILKPVLVQPDHGTPIVIEIRLPQQDSPRVLKWQLTLEDGSTQTGSFIQADLNWQFQKTLYNQATQSDVVMDIYHWVLPTKPAWGYHLLELFDEGHSTPCGEMALIMTPTQCFLPEGLEDGHMAKRLFGPAIQLYALRSKRNWGMGDFTDLANLMTWCGKHNASVVGVNPLHELFPHQPLHKSPYSPSSRAFLNSLYVDIEAVPEFTTSPEAQTLFNETSAQETLAAARSAEYVDYSAVAAVKRPLFEVLYETFLAQHWDLKTPRAQQFQQYLEMSGTALKQFAVFQALHEYFVKQDLNQWYWANWPEAYRQPESQAVYDFAEKHEDRVRFFQYLQWLAHEQLMMVKTTAQQEGLPLGLYADLAVGSDISGGDVWLNQSLYALTMSVGAPSDECNQLGQNWGLPPYHPARLQETAYIPFIRMLRLNMQYSGALRLDHVMGLMRLFWIPEGEDARTGAYVRYPFDDLLGIMALESHRNQCMVIGEDLGTVPDEVQLKMGQWKVLSYKLLFFERKGLGVFKQPEEYSRLSLCALTTHDLPTLTGFWNSEDIDIRIQLNLYPNDDFKHRQINDRHHERVGLLNALKDAGLLPASVPHDYEHHLPEMAAEIMAAVHQYLLRCGSALMVFQLEELLGQPKQVNLPGTVDEYPNWQRKLTTNMEDWDHHPGVQSFLSVACGSSSEKVLMPR